VEKSFILNLLTKTKIFVWFKNNQKPRWTLPKNSESETQL